jgi:molybdenum-dependent DNA-binding transcriptional regulator ModE
LDDVNNLDAIPVFVKVVEAGSFSAAARLLNMPKTTVSAKIAALEKRLALKLIQRTTRKLHVTDAGMKYFRHCANAIRELELGETKKASTKDSTRYGSRTEDRKRMCRWPAASLPMISRPSKRWPFSVKALPGYPTFSPPTLLIVGHRVRPLYAGVYGNFRPVVFHDRQLLGRLVTKCDVGA